jgi:hypothetical protein
VCPPRVRVACSICFLLCVVFCCVCSERMRPSLCSVCIGKLLNVHSNLLLTDMRCCSWKCISKHQISFSSESQCFSVLVIFFCNVVQHRIFIRNQQNIPDILKAALNTNSSPVQLCFELDQKGSSHFSCALSEPHEC